MPHSVEGLLEVCEHVVDVSLMFELVFFTHDSYVEYMFYCASAMTETCLVFGNDVSAWGFILFKMTFNMILMPWLIRLTVQNVLHSWSLPFLGMVMMIDLVHVEGHLPGQHRPLVVRRVLSVRQARYHLQLLSAIKKKKCFDGRFHFLSEDSEFYFSVGSSHISTLGSPMLMSPLIP